MIGPVVTVFIAITCLLLGGVLISFAEARERRRREQAVSEQAPPRAVDFPLFKTGRIDPKVLEALLRKGEGVLDLGPAKLISTGSGISISFPSSTTSR